jgi:hypothetical protein
MMNPHGFGRSTEQLLTDDYQPAFEEVSLSKIKLGNAGSEVAKVGLYREQIEEYLPLRFYKKVCSVFL